MRDPLLRSGMAGLFDGTSLERPVTCERCERPLDECECPRDASGEILLPRDQPARVQREKRRGKQVTVISGLDPEATDLRALLKDLRGRLGAGGTIAGDGADAVIEVQGDHADRLVALLKERGYPAKRSGG